MFEMRYNEYVGEVEFDDEASLFHGRVANLRDVVTFQGTSVAELRKALADSVEDYLEVCAARGDAPKRLRSVEDELREDLIRTFAKFDKVRAIAVGKYLEEERVFVLLAIQQHDEKLMSSLFAAEYDLHGRFPGTCLYMQYIPIGESALEKYMYYNGTLIWDRDCRRGE